MQPPKNLNKTNKPVDLIKFFTFTSVKTTYMVFSIYQSKNFRNSRLVLGDLYTSFQTTESSRRYLSNVSKAVSVRKDTKKPSNNHYWWKTSYLSSSLCHVHGTTHIKLYVFHTLCNMARQLWNALQLHEKTRNLGMSNLMKQMFYLGIIYILRNFAKGELDSLPWRRKSLF